MIERTCSSADICADRRHFDFDRATNPELRRRGLSHPDRSRQLLPVYEPFWKPEDYTIDPSASST